MSNSSRPRRKPAPEESTIRQTNPVTSLLILQNSLSALVKNLGALSTLIVSLLVLSAAVYEALRGPDISSDLNGDPLRPFAYPFIVKNNSLWFSMVDAKMYCEVEKIVTHNNRSTEAFHVGETSNATVGPGEIVNFRCAADIPAKNIFIVNKLDILDADINMFVKYTMLGVLRTSPRTEFRWYAGGTPPHWIKGKIAD